MLKLIICIFFILIILLVYKRFFYINQKEHFSIKLKHNLYIIVYPNLCEDMIDKVKKICKIKLGANDKCRSLCDFKEIEDIEKLKSSSDCDTNINIIKDTKLQFDISAKKNSRYIIIYDKEVDDSIKDKNNYKVFTEESDKIVDYHQEFINKWVDHGDTMLTKKSVVIECKKIKENFKNYVKDVLNLINIDIKISDNDLKMASFFL